MGAGSPASLCDSVAAIRHTAGVPLPVVVLSSPQPWMRLYPRHFSAAYQLMEIGTQICEGSSGLAVLTTR